MRKAARQINRQQVGRTKSIPAPIGGWNAKNSLAAMPETDAVVLENWFPTTSDVMVRRGFVDWATGMTGQVNTVMAYNSGSVNRLFAAVGDSDGTIYDVTSTGDVGDPLVEELGNSKFEHVNLTTSGGSFLLAVNGADKMLQYDGTVWYKEGDSGKPAITGFNSADAYNINIFKNRVYMIEKASLKAWYLPTNSIGGAASALDFGSVFRKGGYLVAMGTWSVDGGYGMDDNAVFITSEGEVAVYSGTDPSDTAKWYLTGVYSIGSPMGKRSMLKYQGDLLCICKDGLAPMSASLMSSRVNSKVMLSDKIQWAISTATSEYMTNYGWDMQLYPLNNMLILNVPVGTGTQEQYVMNTVTGAWCKFTGWAANCWELYQDQIYFGSNGKVCRAWYGNSDNGAGVITRALPAFSNFGNASGLKRWTMARPILATNGTPKINMTLNTDYNLSGYGGSIGYTKAAGALWDDAAWDVASWGGETTYIRDWQHVAGVGYSATIQFAMAVDGAELRWVSTDYVFEAGGTI